MAIQEIAPEIRYRAGRKNANADALSRTPPTPDGDESESKKEGDADHSQVAMDCSLE